MRSNLISCAALLASAISCPALVQAQSNSFTFSGIDGYDAYGQSVRGAGDVNGDGYDDLIVGSPLAENGGTYRGRVQVISGKDRHVLRTWGGTVNGERLGTSVAGIGDIDGDGRAEVIVGASGASSNGADSGKIVVYSGATGLPKYAMVGPAAGDHYGKCVAGGFDANGDGIGDFAAGAPGDDVNAWGSAATDCGSVRVYSGASGLLIFKHAAFDPDERSGSSIAGIDDVNGDGRDDVLVGSPGTSYVVSGGGRVRVCSGADGATIVYVDGDVIGGHLGTSVSAVRDFDADGLPDFITGAPNDSTGGTNAGRATIYSPATWNVLWTITGGAGHFLGQAVAGLGDMNGDAFTDFAIGSPHANLGFLSDYGRVVTYSGLGGWQIDSFSGSSQAGLFGASVCDAGDTNGDGISDLAIGAPTADGNETNSGTVRLVLMGDAAGTEFCFGDGSGLACPCGNESNVGERAGCRNSFGHGGRLVAEGVARVSADTLSLRASALPTSTVLLFQGTAESNGGNGAVFGDGLRCAGGTVTRMGVHGTVFNAASWPFTTEPDLSVRGNVPATGGTRYYQAWYRNAANFCTSSTFNLTNGVIVTWQP